VCVCVCVCEVATKPLNIIYMNFILQKFKTSLFLSVAMNGKFLRSKNQYTAVAS